MTHWVREVMGLPVSLEIVDDPQLRDNELPDSPETAVDQRRGIQEALVRRVYAELVRADEIFSPFRAESELSRLERGELQEADISVEMREVLQIARTFETASGGVFSLWHAGRFDANGIVKGWAVQRAANLLVEAGVSRFCLNAGGDLVVRGKPDPQAGGGVDAWHIGVRSPWAAQRMVAVLALNDQACATSGLYERGAHITDTRTGTVASYWASVTVVTKDLAVADVLATTVFAMGEAGPEWALREFAVAVLAVRPDASLIVAGPLPLAHEVTA